MHPYEEVDLSRACGLFTVPKDEKRDRLVLDARPSNAYESPECEWTRSLGSLAQLQYLFLQPSEKLLIHAEDLRDFYHCFSVGAERFKRNCLKLRVRPYLCRGLTAYTPELEKYAWLVPSLHTLAMGDTSAVGLAQCAHLGLVLSTQAVELASFISLEGRPPRKGPVCGLMIDDFIVLDRVPKSLSASDCQESSGRRIIREVRAAYDAVGLPRHAGKAVESAPSADFWGGFCDGLLGVLRPAFKRSVPLAHLILRMIQLGWTTPELLETLTGGLVSCLQFRRRCLSILDHVYRPRPSCLRTQSFAPSLELRDELLVAVKLTSTSAPLLPPWS